jgi:hypothetical protein
MTLVLRATKGSALTWEELDGNFTYMDGRISGVEGGTAVNPIDAITSQGNVMTIHYATAYGGGYDTVIMPTAQWNGRGAWLPNTAYSANDIFSESNNIYVVLLSHTSGATFDPGLTIGVDHVYDFLFGPLGETVTQTLTGATYTLQVTDNLTYYRVVSTCTITVPASADVPVPLNSEISFCQRGGGLAFVAASGVTMNVPEDRIANTDHTGAVVTLKKVGLDEWDLFGALVLTSA